MISVENILWILVPLVASILLGLLFLFIVNAVRNKKKQVSSAYKQQIAAEPGANSGQILSEGSMISPDIKIPNAIFIKIVAIICLIFWVIAVLITWNSPSTTYEANIYTSTPFIYWLANLFNLIAGICIIIHQIANRNYGEKSNLKIIGFILVFFALASVFLLWILRGYALMGAGTDSITHLGWIKNIINSGHLEAENYYPITHIYIAQLSQITNVSPDIFTNRITFVFILYYILFTYCLARTILPKKRYTFLVITVLITYLSSYWIQLTPNVLANFYLPLTVFVLIKCFYSNLIQWKIILATIIVIIPMFHPLVGFTFTAIILVIWLFGILFVHENSKTFKRNMYYVLALSFVLLIWCVYWTSHFQIWTNLMVDMVANLTTRTVTTFSRLLGEVTYASNYYSIIPVFFKTYLGQLIIITLTALCFIILWRRGIWKNRFLKAEYKGFLLLFSPMPMLAIAIVALYLSNASFEPTRLIIHVILLCTFFAGYLLYETIRRGNITNYRNPKSKFSKISVPTISILLIFIFVMGVLQFYPSRYLLQLNWQVTHTEFTGMHWFTKYKTIGANTTSFTVDATRWATLDLTRIEYYEQGYRWYGAAKQDYLYMPWHFGYDEELYLGQFFENDLYMVLSDRDRIAYEETWPELASIRLVKEDFDRIENDTSISKLYSNQGLEAYYVNSVDNVKFQLDPYNWTK